VELPGGLSITAVDVAAHEMVASLAEGHGKLTGLALWIIADGHWVVFEMCKRCWRTVIVRGFI